MLEPNQFEENEAWTAFRLNSAPIQTKQDGDFNCVALMDIATGVILGMEMVPLSDREPSRRQIESLLESAKRRGVKLADTLYLPLERQVDSYIEAAEAARMEVRLVPETAILALTEEAREGFEKYMQRGPGLQ